MALKGNVTVINEKKSIYSFESRFVSAANIRDCSSSKPSAIRDRNLIHENYDSSSMVLANIILTP